jgi:hypothetical protein
VVNSTGDITSSVRIEDIVLEDGRVGEQRMFLDDDGNKVIETWVQQKSPILMEKRTVQVMKDERIEVLKDGEMVVQEEASEDNVDMTDNLNLGSLKEEITKAIVSGLSIASTSSEAPELSVQEVIKDRLESKKSSKTHWVNAVCVIVIVSQLAFLAYMLI